MSESELIVGRRVFEACVDEGLIPPASWNQLDSVQMHKWCAVADSARSGRDYCPVCDE